MELRASNTMSMPFKRQNSGSSYDMEILVKTIVHVDLHAAIRANRFTNESQRLIGILVGITLEQLQTAGFSDVQRAELQR
jgi:hypothetical protein